MSNKDGGFYTVRSIAMTLFLGILVAALWDVLVKDFMYYLGGEFASTAASIYSGYFDLLYENVGVGHQSLIYFPAILSLVVFTFSPVIHYFILSRYFKRDGVVIDGRYRPYKSLPANEANEADEADKSRVRNISEKNLKRIFWLFDQMRFHPVRTKIALSSPMLIFSFMFMHILIQFTSGISAQFQIERNLQIIRPYITETDYYKLNSDYRMVDDLSKLTSIVVRIEEVAKNNKLDLPVFTLYGI
jgi:hypothetical protein